jgi:hypothetical protein
MYERDDPNPANECQRCIPGSSTSAWSDADPNATCGTGGGQFCCAGECCAGGQCCHAREGTCGAPPCECLIANETYPEGALNPNNQCQVCNPHDVSDLWSPIDDGVRCNAPLEGVRECCDGVCCAEDECCRGDRTCGACECTIDGVTWPRAAANPANECEICSPAVDHERWTPLTEGSFCGPNLAWTCCEGSCQETCEEECRPAGPGVNTAEACPGTCIIDSVVYNGGERNPANDCEFCDPSVSESSWTEAPFFTKCGDGLDRMCCAGTCCSAGTCCRPGFSSCSIEWCGLFDPCDYLDPCGCTINGTLYLHGEENPANSCQYCSTWWSETDWTSKSNNSRCGPFDDQFCCNDVCCAEAGTCCNSEGICAFEGDFSCRGCVIGGRFYRNFEENPANGCEICDTSQSTTSWTVAQNYRICGTVDDPVFGSQPLYCCEGVCCPEPTHCCSTSGTCVHTAVGPCQFS